MDTAPPAGHMDTAPPAGHMDTAPPAGHMDTAPPAGHMDTAPPAGHMDTAPEDGTKGNDEGWEILDIVSSSSPAAGGGHRAGHMDTAPPAGHVDTAPPAGHVDTAPPAGHVDTALSAGHMDTAPPAGHVDTAPPAGHVDTAPPAGHVDTAPPAGHVDTAPPAGHVDTALSAGHVDTAPPGGHTETAPPAGHVDTALSAGHVNTAPPAGHMDTAPPAGHMDTAPPAGHMDTAPPEDGTEENEEGWVIPDQDSSPAAEGGSSCTDIEKSVGIFYWDMDAHVKSLLNYPVKTISSMKRFLDFCSSKHGAENMIKVISDSEDAESQEQNHSEWGQSLPCPQVTLTEAELDAISPSDDVSIGRRMADKVKQMRKILQVDADNSLFYHLWFQDSQPVIGIFSREAESQYSWLMSALRSHPYRDRIAEVRPCPISNNGLQQFYQDLSLCKFGILYHSKMRGRINVTDVMDALYDEELKELSSTHGKDNVIVVIDDLEDSSDQEKCRILSHQPSIGTMAAGLFLISLEEKKSNYQRYLMVTKEQAEKKLQELTEEIRKMESGEKAEGLMPLPGEREKSGRKEQNKSKSRENITQTVSGAHWGDGDGRSGPVPAGSEKPGTQPEKKRNFRDYLDVEIAPPEFNKKSIGIFSRSSESEYSWLQMLLESQDFSNCVQSVRSCLVSNVFSEFCNEVTRCKFGILYHSKNRGRINVTDVTDSLYDDELKLLSTTLGKKNVVVVIDDLDDASDAMKNKLLSAQHNIEKLARDLILVQRSSSEEKMCVTRDALKKVFP
ncbi:uncharacterized protein LOC121008275 isoform X3 [Bufo bufo]|uniref:uncharacterized protein LOC121008275 isoform X3 n=1 Tax=Bufo bufo TaxID=8384 RepID=UPI001ABE66E2|nr:uncharacterized protein LOC121008275 isoform X3 [Bufo bufo]